MTTWPTKNDILLQGLDDIVEGHNYAKKCLIAMLQRSNMRHYQKYMKEMHRDYLMEPMKLLLIGGSGTGKTHLVDALDSLINIPLVKVDATQFNVTGGSGGMKVGHLKKQIRDTAELMCKCFPTQFFSYEGAVDRTVVFVDEIDKLGGSGSVGEWNRGVQSDFLTLFDDKDEFAGVSFIFAGAFSEITRYKQEKTSIGFTKHKQTDESLALLDDRICATGLLPELVGRFSAIAELDKFTVDDFYRILKERIFPNKQRDLAMFHIFDIELSDERMHQIAEEAYKSSQGVRYLKRSVDREFIEQEFNAHIEGACYHGI